MYINDLTRRRLYVAELVQKSGKLTPDQKREVAQMFGCAYTTVCNDVALIKDPGWWQRYRETHQVANENIRARNAGIPGYIDPGDWRELCRVYNYTCLRCGERKLLVMDHVIPLSRGGTNTIDNIQPLCAKCNLNKGVRSTDYRYR